jgi:Fur family peroxide stress response transcriptional regulator
MEKMVAKLREGAFRITPQRLAILEIMAAGAGHPSVDQVYEQIKKGFPTTSLATVYKTVNLLKSMNEVLELGFADMGSRYDGAKPYPHPHVICTKCGRIVDPAHISMDDLTLKLEQETGFKITRHQLYFFGECRDCSEKG